MLKKTFLIVLLVGFTGVLVWGGVNRTRAKSDESISEAQLNGKGYDQNGESLELEAREHDDVAYLEQDGHVRGQPKFESQESRGNGAGTGRVDTQTAGSLGYQNEGGDPSSSESGGNGYRGQGNGAGRRQGNSGEPLDDAEIQALELALDDEYHALAVYLSVMDDFGPVAPFVEIAESEQRHIDALLKQFDKYGLPVPDNPWIGNVASFDSVQAACAAGVEAEIANANLYDQLFAMTDDPALIQVFTNLQRASQESHLPEFQSCQ